jgi:hypothetical protein
MLKDMVKKVPGARKVAHALGLAPKTLEPRRFLLEMLPKNSVGVEIGVHKGDFSQKLLEVVNPKELHLIDPWKHESSATYKNALYGGKAKNGQNEMDERYSNVCVKFDREIRGERVKIHRGYSTDVLAQFPDEYFDWVYIDGNHLYEYVKKDIELSFCKTKVGGLITGDDYTEGGWWEGGVKKAVDEYATAEQAQLIEIRNGQFIVRKKL